jgi:hypothetical protein
MWIEMKEFARLCAFWRPNGNMASAESPVSHLNRGITDEAAAIKQLSSHMTCRDGGLKRRKL